MTGVSTAAARFYVEMEMVAVVVIVAGTEHGGEILAAIGAHAVQETARAEREQAGLLHVDVAAAGELYAADVDCVAGRVLGHGMRAVDAPAGIAGQLVDRLHPAPVAAAGGRVEL